MRVLRRLLVRYRAAGKIEHRIAGAHAARRREPALPETMHAERHQVIHHIVFFRDRREYASDEFFLLTDRHVAVAEIPLRDLGSVVDAL